jgi:hypothetical protein
MRKFAESWANIEIVQRTVAQIPWRSNITLLDKIKEPELRLWYAKKNNRKWLWQRYAGVSNRK